MKYSFTRLPWLMVLLWISCYSRLHAQVLDPSFQPTVLKIGYLGGLQTGVQRLAVQPDGKVITVGGFDFVNGVLASKIQRLNANGTSDATFNPGGIGANGFIGAVALQPDGRIVIAGGFTSYNGTPALALARLNSNGTLDPSFASLPATGVGLRQLSALAIQPNGKILVGSSNSFTAGQAGVLVRLNADGTPDATFNIGTGAASGLVNAILVQPDGKIVVGGSFPAFNGQNGSLVRLNADGSLDTTFGLGTGFNFSVNTLALQPDSKILVGGSFTQVNGQAAPGIARILATGSLDATFAPGTGATTATGAASSVQSLVLLSNGNVLVAGNFAQFNGVARGRVARLLPTGTLDATYATGAGANNTITGLGMLPSGQVLAVGLLTQYDGMPKTGLALLSATGADDPTFATLVESKGSINRAVPLPSGQLLVQGNFTSFNGVLAPGAATDVRRVNANGTLDNTFSAAAPSGASLVGVQPNGSFYLLSRLSISRLLPSGAIDNTFTTQPFLPTSAGLQQALVVQPDGKVIAMGNFASYAGVARNGIVRLLPDGNIDASYVPPVGTVVRTYFNPFLLSSGKLLVSYIEATGGAAGTQLVRLNADGTVDNTFSLGTGPTAGSTFTVFEQPNGEILLFGSFTTFNGQATPYGWVRLTANGAVASTLPGLTASYSPNLVLPDGRILASIGNYGTRTLVRLNTDGSLDNTFTALSTPNGIFIGDDSSPSYVLQPDGKIIAFGNFRSIGGQVRIGLARLTNPNVTATRAATAVLPLHVYPNPASQRLTLVRPADVLAATQATLLDLTGRPVCHWALPAGPAEASIDLSTVAAGMYVLRVPGTAATYQQKVVVTH